MGVVDNNPVLEAKVAALETEINNKAPSSEGVTNGNSHDHSGGDGASIPLAGLDAIADQTIPGNVSGGPAPPSALTATQIKTMLGLLTSSTPQFAGIGLGAAAGANTAITVALDKTNTTTFGHSCTINFRASADVTNYCYAANPTLNAFVADGKTNAGRAYGYDFTIFRANIASINDSGTLSILTGNRITHGHYDTDKTANPTTTTVYGFSLNGNIKRGTIGTYYPLYVATPANVDPPDTWTSGTAIALNVVRKPTVASGYWHVCTTAGTTGGVEPTWSTTPGGTTPDNNVVWTCIVIPTITTEYGVYQASTTAKNYFAANVGLGTSSFGTSAAKAHGIASGTAPTTSPADMAHLWVQDIALAAGKAGLHTRGEATPSGAGSQIMVAAVYKTDTGDPAYAWETLMCINVSDNNIKMYADGAWRQLATW